MLLQLNVVQFSVAGLGMLSGSLTVKASYKVASDERVDIKFIESTLVCGHWRSCNIICSSCKTLPCCAVGIRFMHFRVRGCCAGFELDGLDIASVSG
jgi:hypothetical protein